MKFLSVFAILCLALSSNQVNSAVVNGPAETAEKLFNDLKETVQKAVDGALGTLSGLVGNIVNDAVELEEAAKEKLVDASKSFSEQIDKAVAAAKAKGLDVSDCVGNSKEEIAELPDEILNNVTSCIEDTVDRVADLIDDLVEDINGTVRVVLSIGDQMRNCEEESIFTQAICLAKVTVKITAEVVKLPLKITKDVADATVYVASAAPKLVVCNAQSAATLAFNAGGIVKDVTLCITEESNASSTPSGSESTSPASPPTTPGASESSPSASPSTTPDSSKATSPASPATTPGASEATSPASPQTSPEGSKATSPASPATTPGGSEATSPASPKTSPEGSKATSPASPPTTPGASESSPPASSPSSPAV